MLLRRNDLMLKRLATAVLATLTSAAAIAAEPPEAKPDPAAAASTVNAPGEKKDPVTPAKKAAGNKGAAKPTEGKRAPIKYEGC
jgi:hypothetical protein